MGSRGRAAKSAAFFALGLGITGVAEAHPGHTVVRTERYVKLDVGTTGARIVVSETLGSEEFLRQSRRADANHDGTVTREEAQAFLGDYANMLRREMPARLDGSFVRVDWSEPFLDPIGPVRARPGTLELVGHVRIPAGQHTLFLTDDTPQETLERTDVSFLVRDGVRLIASGANEAPTEVVRTLAFGKDAPARRAHSLAMTVMIPEAVATKLPAPRPMGLTAVVLLLFSWTALAIAIARLQRERKAVARARPNPPS